MKVKTDEKVNIKVKIVNNRFEIYVENKYVGFFVVNEENVVLILLLMMILNVMKILQD